MAFGGIPTPGLKPRQSEQPKDERAQACGRTVGFVLALGAQARDGAMPAIDAARHAHTAGTFVLASPERSQAATEEVRRAGSKGRSMLQAMEYDDSMLPPDDREPFGLPYYLVSTMRAVAESSLDDYEAIVVVDAGDADIASTDIIELCAEAKKAAGQQTPASRDRWNHRLLRIPRAELEAVV